MTTRNKWITGYLKGALHSNLNAQTQGDKIENLTSFILRGFILPVIRNEISGCTYKNWLTLQLHTKS